MAAALAREDPSLAQMMDERKVRRGIGYRLISISPVRLSVCVERRRDHSTPWVCEMVRHSTAPPIETGSSAISDRMHSILTSMSA